MKPTSGRNGSAKPASNQTDSIQQSFGALVDSNGNRGIMMNPGGGHSSKQQIEFKSTKNPIGDRNQGFKPGGPIKATNAVFEGSGNQIQTVTNQFSINNGSFKNTATPAGLA
jgi:hypothetical protein